MSTDGRLPGWDFVSENPQSGGNSYSGPPYYNYKPMILLHQTVGTSLSRGYIAGHSVPPHLWYNPYTGEKWQTVELDRAALALYQPQYGYHWTNKHTYCLQTELVGVPVVNQATYSEAQCQAIARDVIVPQVLWLRQRGLPIDLSQVKYHANTSGSASVDWPGRMSEQEFADFNGVCAHIDAWGNDHWDCSAERIDLMVQYARQILDGTPIPPSKFGDTMPARLILNKDTGTQYAASADGSMLVPLVSQNMKDNWVAWGFIDKTVPMLELADWQVRQFPIANRGTFDENLNVSVKFGEVIARLNSIADILAKLPTGGTSGSPTTVDYERINRDVLNALAKLTLRSAAT